MTCLPRVRRTMVEQVRHPCTIVTVPVCPPVQMHGCTPGQAAASPCAPLKQPPSRVDFRWLATAGPARQAARQIPERCTFAAPRISAEFFSRFLCFVNDLKRNAPRGASVLGVTCVPTRCTFKEHRGHGYGLRHQRRSGNARPRYPQDCTHLWQDRNAYAFTSGAYLVNLLLMAPSSQGLEPPGKAGRFS
jgi:hypothetical protein